MQDYKNATNSTSIECSNINKMNTFLVIAFLDAFIVVVFSQNPDLNNHWKLYKETFKKKYSNIIDEEHDRRIIWEENLRKIESHNRLYDLGIKSFRLGINQFTDLTSEEFQKQYTSSKSESKHNTSDNDFKFTTKLEALPSRVDWREKGVVTKVKNQGQCGSCWTFSATGSVESHNALKNGNLISLSEQNLLDCSEGNFGCDGGWAYKAFEYIMHNDGIDTETSYPYEAVKGQCRFNRNSVGTTIKNYKFVQHGDERALQQAVAQIGPISVAIDSSHDSFQHYSDGVYNEIKCSTEWTNHVVLVVGYGTERGHDYWLVKNSWGTSWGDEGYVKMSRNNNNQCAIASYGVYPIL